MPRWETKFQTPKNCSAHPIRWRACLHGPAGVWHFPRCRRLVRASLSTQTAGSEGLTLAMSCVHRLMLLWARIYFYSNSRTLRIPKDSSEVPGKRKSDTKHQLMGERTTSGRAVQYELPKCDTSFCGGFHSAGTHLTTHAVPTSPLER